MKSLFKFLLIATILAAAPQGAWAQQGKQPYTKTIKRQFEVDPDGTVMLHNQMGNIRTQAGTGDRMKLTITIRVKAGSERLAQDYFNRINVSISDNPSSVRVVTETDPWKAWNTRSSGSDYRIDYLVTLPSTMQLRINNRFGKVDLADIRNDAHIELQHGDLTAGNIDGHLRLMMAHGNARVGDLGNLTGDLAHATLYLGDTRDARLQIRHGSVNGRDAKYVSLESQHSQAEFANTDRVDYTGRYDDIQFTSVNKLYGEGRYSSINSQDIRDHLDLNLRHSNVRVDHLHRGFSAVHLDGDHTEYRIFVAPGASFSLDASARYAGIRYPRDMEVTYEEERSSEHHVRAYVGTPNPRSVIRANLNYGALRLSD